MALTDQKKPFYLDFDGRRYRLPLNPETYECSWRTRAAVQPTLDGGFEDNFGLHVPGSTCRIAGTFGVKSRADETGQAREGLQQFQLLETMFKDFYGRFKAATAAGKPRAARFHDLASGHHFEVEVNEFRLLRNISRQFLYQYTISMTILASLTEGGKQTDALRANPAAPLAAVAQAVEGLDSAQATLQQAAGPLVRRQQTEEREARLLARDVVALDARVSGVRVAAKQYLAGGAGYIPVERAEVQKTATMARALAANMGGHYDARSIPFEAIRATRQIQRNLQALAAKPDLFRGGGGFQ